MQRHRVGSIASLKRKGSCLRISPSAEKLIRSSRSKPGPCIPAPPSRGRQPIGSKALRSSRFADREHWNPGRICYPQWSAQKRLECYLGFQARHWDWGSYSDAGVTPLSSGTSLHVLATVSQPLKIGRHGRPCRMSWSLTERSRPGVPYANPKTHSWPKAAKSPALGNAAVRQSCDP